MGIFAKLGRAGAAAAIVAAAAAAPSAFAGVVYQNVGDLANGANINQSWCSGCGGSYRVFDQITLASAETITGFTASFYGGAPYWPVPVTFSIFSVTGGMPGALLFSQDVDVSDFTTTNIAGAPFGAVLAHTDVITGLNLAAGNYYVSFFSNNLGVNAYNAPGKVVYQQGAGTYANSASGFALFNDAVPGTDVPEPASLAILGLGLVGLAAARRKKA